MLQDFLPWDLEMVDLLGEVLVPGSREARGEHRARLEG